MSILEEYGYRVDSLKYRLKITNVFKNPEPSKLDKML